MQIWITRVCLAFLIALVIASSTIIYILPESKADSKTPSVEANNLRSGVAFDSMNETTSTPNNMTNVEVKTADLPSHNEISVSNTSIFSFSLPNYDIVDENNPDNLTYAIDKQNLDNGLTNNFGFAIQTAPDAISYFYREGSTHAQDKGVIVMRPFTISTLSWGNDSVVYSDPVLDCRNVAGGKINDKIYLFFYRYNFTGRSSIGSDIGYIVSSDLNASSWSQYTPLFNNTKGSPYGTLTQIGQSSTWLLGYYVNNNGISRLRLITTRDNGNTWAIRQTVYNGTNLYAEPALTYMGNNRIVMLARQENGGSLQQFTSDDRGITWTNSGTTNLGSNIANQVNIPSIQASGNTLFVLWADRGTAKIMLSRSTFDVFNNPSLYNAGVAIDGLGNAKAIDKSGYPSFVVLENGDLFYVYGYAVDNYNVQISSGIIHLSDIT